MTRKKLFSSYNVLTMPMDKYFLSITLVL